MAQQPTPGQTLGTLRDHSKNTHITHIYLLLLFLIPFHSKGCPLKPSEWTSWSSCTESCGRGSSLRTREVVTGCGSSCNLTTLTESQTCYQEPCSCPLLPTEWSSWTNCSSKQSCGDQGVQVRTRRVINNTGGSCYLENETLVRSCDTEPCPCPHVPTQWSKWTECSVSCGGGMHSRSRDVVLGAGSYCFKYPALRTKTCNMDECPGKCFWWEFMGGKVLKGIPPGREDCFDDIKLLPLKAQKYIVGMGSEYIEMINPVKSVCGACILFTSLGGKVGISFVYGKLVCLCISYIM